MASNTLIIPISPENTALVPVVTETMSVLNNFYEHRLRVADQIHLSNFIGQRILSISNMIKAFDHEPYLVEGSTNLKKLVVDFSETVNKTPLIGTCAVEWGILSSALVLPLVNVAALYGALFVALTVHNLWIKFPAVAEASIKLFGEFWEGIDRPENIQYVGGCVRVFGFTTDYQTSQNLLLNARIVAIGGKILLLEKNNEVNAILKVLSQFVRFEKEDLKKLAVTSPDQCHYYEDGSPCEVYHEIFNQQKNQWSNPEELLKIIEAVAAHRRRQRKMSMEGVENEEFPCYFAPEPQFNSEVEKEEEFIVM